MDWELPVVDGAGRKHTQHTRRKRQPHVHLPRHRNDQPCRGLESRTQKQNRESTPHEDNSQQGQPHNPVPGGEVRVVGCQVSFAQQQRTHQPESRAEPKSSGRVARVREVESPEKLAVQLVQEGAYPG